MDYAIPEQLWSAVIPLSAAVGAVAGLVWDIGNAVRRSASDPGTGLDNVLSLPRIVHRRNGTRDFDLGLIGPIAVGALTAILVVLLVGRTVPGAEEAATAISEVSETAAGAGSATAAQEIAEENLGTQIDRASLVVLAIIGGLSGWPLLQTLTTRASKLLEAAVGAALTPAANAAKEAVAEKAETLQLSAGDKEQLASAAEAAVKEGAPTALRPT